MKKTNWAEKKTEVQGVLQNDDFEQFSSISSRFNSNSI